MKTTLIHGTNDKGIELIESLLSKNNSAQNIINNQVLCVDYPQNQHKVQQFMNTEGFSFFPLLKDAPFDISEHIDQVIIASEQGGENA